MTLPLPPQNPTETDLFQANRFSFVLSKLPETIFFCQRISIPGISLAAIAQPNIFANISHPSSKLEYDTMLSLSFKVNENLKNYMEIHNWMVGLGQPRQFGGLKNLKESNNTGNGEYSDLIITIRTPKGNPALYIKCHRCFPVVLSPIELQTDNSDVQYTTATVQFSYTTFTVESL